LYDGRELLYLRRLGAEFLSDLSEDTLEGFSRIAGGKFADAWIRKEVKRYHQAAGILHPCLFATCDLMNAFASSAEGLGVLYFSKGEESESYSIKDVDQLAELVIDLAVSFKQIEYDNAIYSGIWSGKTIWQWEEDCLMRQ
jgi:hypothetical protein